jgi:hypothetical protein
MLPCSKIRYPNRWSAESALRAIQQKKRGKSSVAPTGAYWCPSCRAFHLTSESLSRPAPWERRQS